MSRERMLLEHHSHTSHMLSLLQSEQAKDMIAEQRANLPPCARCRRWRKRVATALVAIAVAAGVLVVGYFDKQAQDLEAAQYCQMHALWIESKGDVGWPDFRGTYAKECGNEAAQ